MITVSLEEAVALLYIEWKRDRVGDPLVEILRRNLSPEAGRIADLVAPVTKSPVRGKPVYPENGERDAPPFV